MSTFTLTWLDLKQRWLKQHGHSTGVGEAGWAGGSVEDTSRWVASGYDLPSYSGQPVFTPRKRRRPVWNAEDGAFDLTRAMCGDENYRLTRSPREHRHGAKVEIGYGFTADISAQTIGQYGLVCGAIIRKLEAEGLDVSVDIVSRASGYLRGHSKPGEKHEVHIQVKKVGERSDFRSWSAIFAPTGHRHLMFLAREMHNESLGLQYMGPGGSRHEAWKVERDGDTIRIDCQSSGYAGDPTDTLTRQAEAAGIL